MHGVRTVAGAVADSLRRSLGRASRIAAVVSGMVLLGGCEPGAVPRDSDWQRDRDPWVMRSVLDQEIRMVTLALHNDGYAAYNTANCALYKVWRGGVHWDGVAFNNVKTVQPESWGEAYWETASDDKPWRIEQNGAVTPVEPVFKGYTLDDNQVTFRYALELSDGQLVTIFERPEFLPQGDGKVGFQRLFRTEGMPDGVVLWNGDIRLPVNGEELFTDYFDPVTADLDPDQLRPDSQFLLDRNGCTTCHEIDEQTIGPSFRMLSARYGSAPDWSVVRVLRNKVIEGGVGAWGDVPMIAHPDLNGDVVVGMIYQMLAYEPDHENLAAAIERLAESGSAAAPGKPGFGSALEGHHPGLRVQTIRPDGFEPRVGGMDFLSDGRLLVSTWDAVGAVYALEGVESGDASRVRAVRIAEGLAEPLGLKVVDDEIFVLQKQELTQLVDHDGDGITDEYRTIANGWGATTDFHEFAFGLEYRDGYFYATLGLAHRLEETELQVADRGTLIRIARDGTFDNIMWGLRQTNGIGTGPGGELFITENQGQWMPASKVIHVQEGQFHGSHYRMGDRYKGQVMTPPALWLPQNEIGNSPSQPALIPHGTYAGQMLHGEVTHGGLKRVFLEKVGGAYQGAVFRFTQGLESGINRIAWGPDNALYVGGVGMTGDWGWKGTQFGLQRLEFTGESVFEILKIEATPAGFDVTFTEPLAAGHGDTLDDYLLQQWWYQPTARYGGDKMDLETLAPGNVTVSADRRTVHLEVPGLNEGWVVYFLLNDELQSSTGQSLWSGEAWYTLNAIPDETIH